MRLPSFNRCIEFSIQCRLHLINSVADFYLFIFRLAVKAISFQRGPQLFLPSSDIRFYFLTYIFKRFDEKSTGAAGWITDNLTFLRIEYFRHKIYNCSRRKELTKFTSEGCTEELLKSDALYIILRIRKIVIFQFLQNLNETIFSDFDFIIILKQMVFFKFDFCSVE